MGSLDDPAQFPPKVQMGMEGKLAWCDSLPGLPDSGTTEQDMAHEAAAIAASNHQHPDHDTAVWPPA